MKGYPLASDDTKRFIGLSSFEILAMFRRGLFYAYLTIYLRHYLGLSVTATTLFATLPMVVNVLSQTFIWGRVSDHFQLRRSLIITGEVSAALSTLAVWYLHRLPDTPRFAGFIIIFGLTVVELFWSMSNISWSALISDLYTEELRGTIQGRLNSMGGLGRIMGIWVGGFLYEGLGNHTAGWGFYHGDLFFVASGVMLISTLPLFLLPEGGIRSVAAPSPRNHAVSGSLSGNLRIYLMFLAGMLMINFGRNSIAIIFPQYLASESGRQQPHLKPDTEYPVGGNRGTRMDCGPDLPKNRHFRGARGGRSRSCNGFNYLGLQRPVGADLSGQLSAWRSRCPYIILGL
jgi:hypothetical protein